MTYALVLEKQLEQVAIAVGTSRASKDETASKQASKRKLRANRLRRRPFFEPLEDRRLLAAMVSLMDAPSQNQSLPFDTTGDAHVSPIDLLAIVNYLNAPQASGEEGGTSNAADPGAYMLDVNGDTTINATDATLVTDYLNSPPPPTTGKTGGGTTSSMIYPPPTVAITSIPGSVNEGEIITISGTMTNAYGIFGDFGGNWKQVSHAWDSTLGTWSYTGFYTDDDATGTPSDARTITVTAINMMSIASTSSPLTVNNVVPTIRPLGTLTPVNEGTQLDLAIKFTDAITYYTTNTGINMAEMVRDNYSIVVNWGDGTSTPYTASYIPPQNQTPGQPFQTDITINASHTYADDGPSPGNGTASDEYKISITLKDDDAIDPATGAIHWETTTSVATVTNVAPTITLNSAVIHDTVIADGMVNEGEDFTVSGSISDIGIMDAQFIMLDVDLNFDGDTTDPGEEVNISFNPTSPLTFAHTFTMPTLGVWGPWSDGVSTAPLNVNAPVTDDDGGTSSGTQVVYVAQLANPQPPTCNNVSMEMRAAPPTTTHIDDAFPHMTSYPIRPNIDNDDNDVDPTNNVPLVDMNDALVIGENDLVHTRVKLNYTFGQLWNAGYAIRLTRTNNSPLRAFGRSDKSVPILPDNVASTLIFPVNQNSKDFDFFTEWAAAYAPNTSDSLSIELMWSNNPQQGQWFTCNRSADIEFVPLRTDTIVIAFVGESQDVNDSTGMSQIVGQIRSSGYDVHLFDEDDVGKDRWITLTNISHDRPVLDLHLFQVEFPQKPVSDWMSYQTVREAVLERGATKIAILGYSHGGGAAYMLSDAIAADQVVSALAEIEYTAYIDAVEKGKATPETRKPLPGSQYHYNVYQSNLADVLGITPDFATPFKPVRGDDIQGAVSDNADTSGDGDAVIDIHYGFLGEHGAWERHHTNTFKRGIAESLVVQRQVVSRLKSTLQ